MQVIHISDEPTYDIVDFVLVGVREEDRLCYFETKFVYKFDKVYGSLGIRSRAMRFHEKESTYVENVISAIIDAGYCGKISRKTKMTHEWLRLRQSIQDKEAFAKLFTNCQQMYLFPSAALNYYNIKKPGTHQTQLEPDVKFML
jgi:hypothetical protein